MLIFGRSNMEGRIFLNIKQNLKHGPQSKSSSPIVSTKLKFDDN